MVHNKKNLSLSLSLRLTDCSSASNFAARFLAQQKASDASDTVDYAELKAQVHEHRVRGALRQQAAATLRNAAAKARLSRVEQFEFFKKKFTTPLIIRWHT